MRSHGRSVADRRSDHPRQISDAIRRRQPSGNVLDARSVGPLARTGPVQGKGGTDDGGDDLLPFDFMLAAPGLLTSGNFALIPSVEHSGPENELTISGRQLTSRCRTCRASSHGVPLRWPAPCLCAPTDSGWPAKAMSVSSNRGAGPRRSEVWRAFPRRVQRAGPPPSGRMKSSLCQAPSAWRKMPRTRGPPRGRWVYGTTRSSQAVNSPASFAPGSRRPLAVSRALFRGPA